MTSLPLTSLVTLLVVALMFWTAINVGKARAKYEVKAPATSGHEKFDRAYRVQMNTLESAMLLLPSMWIYANLMGTLVPAYQAPFGSLDVFGMQLPISKTRQSGARDLASLS